MKEASSGLHSSCTLSTSASACSGGNSVDVAGMVVVGAVAGVDVGSAAGVDWDWDGGTEEEEEGGTGVDVVVCGGSEDSCTKHRPT